MKRTLAFGAATLFAASAAFAANDTARMDDASARQEKPAQISKDSPLKLPDDAKGFAAELHEGNQKEIRLGQLAQKNAQSDQVKQFGKMLVDDHQKADQQLMDMAKQQKWTLKAPEPKDKVGKAIKAAEKANEEKLKVLDGAAFDQAFMASMVEDHDMDLTRVAEAQQKYQASPLTGMLTQLAPRLQQHREHAYKVLGDVKAQAQGVGGSGLSGGAPQGATTDQSGFDQDGDRDDTKLRNEPSTPGTPNTQSSDLEKSGK